MSRKPLRSAVLLACDWGSTSLRAWTVADDGEVVSRRDFELGILRLGAGEAEHVFRATVRPGLEADRLPAILCGMVGSELGWGPVGYQDCPAGLDELKRSLVEVASNPLVRIVPGLKGPGFSQGADVLRGEETQALGWMLQEPARAEGRRLVCLPGTHAKWILLEEGRILRFVSFMTGELFGLLRRHGVLRTAAPAGDEAAFDEGLAMAGEGDALAARLFTARSRVAAQGASPASTASYLSGLLIGAEVAASARLLGLDPLTRVELIGDPSLCRWYARALERRGVACASHDGEAAALAGLVALQG